MMDTRLCKLAFQWLIAITLCVLAGCDGEQIDSSTSSSASSDATPDPLLPRGKQMQGLGMRMKF